MHASQIQGCVVEQRVAKKRVRNVVTVRTGKVAGQCAMPYTPRWPVWLGLWTLEERRNQCDLIEMFYGYTQR